VTPPRIAPEALAGRVLDLVDRVVEAGRARTLGVQRAAAVTRRLPAILFGVVVAVLGLAFLALALLRGLVEVTDAVFGTAKPWVAWLVAGGMLLVLGLFFGTMRNTDARRNE
jgi:hypothetical protein